MNKPAPASATTVAPKKKDEVKLTPEQQLFVNEIAQFKIRLAAGALLVIIFVSLIFKAWPIDDNEMRLVYTLCLPLVYLVIAGVQFALIKTKVITTFSFVRLILGQILDFSFTSIGFFMMDDWGASFYPMYLWVILGNAMRFGRRGLLYATIIANVGFLAAVLLSPYWRENWRAALGFEIGLIILPIYFGALLKRINDVQEKLVENEKSKAALFAEMYDLKTKFFANLSHEFRTPIALTLGLVEGIHDGRYGDVSEEVKKQCGVMKRNQGRLLNLINQILDMEKMEKGEYKLQLRPLVSLNKFIERRVEQFAPMATNKKIDLKADLDPAVAGKNLYVDPDKLDKVVFNLLSNALKFTNKGGVTISTRFVDGKIKMTVSDTGIGIRQDQMHKLFQRFQQATGSESKDYAGTGIGLSMIKEIVEMHHGTVSVDSVYQQGTQFHVELVLGKDKFSAEQINEIPFDDDNQITMVAELAAEGKSDTAGIEAHQKWNEELQQNRDPGKKTILFVDDNFDLREFVKDLLAPEFNLFLSMDGQIGFDMAKKVNPDLIISDMMMPVLDGLGFLKLIRAESDFRQVPFLILTAKANSQTKMEALNLGADDFLYKPFNADELKVRVRNLLLLRERQLRIQEDLRAARSIQQSLMPQRFIEMGPYAVEALYHPCDELSGDFYDLWVTPKYLYLYVADVTSHGTASAQVTYVVKSIFAEISNGSLSDAAPKDILPEFAKKFIGYGLQYGVSIQLLRLDFSNGQIKYCSANAPLAMHINKAEAKFISCEPAPVIFAGLYEAPASGFDEVEVQLAPSESFTIYTDGCIEFALPDGNQIGVKRFSKLLKSVEESKDWTDTLLNKLSETHGSRAFEDDVTIIRVLCRPSAHSAKNSA